MAKLSLGRKNWKKFNKPQRQRFLTLFTKQLEDSFLEKLELYTDEKVVYQKLIPKKNKKNKITKIEAPILLISKEDEIKMIFKFGKKKAGWKVYDLEIIGVSVVQTYRSQFKSALQKGTPEMLLTKMEKKGAFSIPDNRKQQK